MVQFDNGVFKGWDKDKKSWDNMWHQVQGDLTPDALDTRTLHQNILGLSYAGSNNPKKYNGLEDYSHTPVQIEDIPAYGHDLGYNGLNIKRANGLFTAQKAIPLDLAFARQEIGIASGSGASVTQIRAIILSVGVGGPGLYKAVKPYISQGLHQNATNNLKYLDTGLDIN